jgi:hypothetical protein
MGVAHFWKRVPGRALDGLRPKEVSDLVPYWFDPGYPAERERGLVVGVENTGYLIGTLLDFGAVGTGHESAATVISGLPDDWDDEWMVGTIRVRDVRRVAGFLLDAPFREWAVRHHAPLAAEAESLGFHGPFDDPWASQVVSGAERLGALFVSAAAHDQAVVARISA